MNSIQSNRFWFLTSIILMVALTRLLFIAIPNFSPIGAIALFGGVYFRDKIFAFVVPLAALFITDILLEMVAGIGFYSGMIYVYGAFFLTGCLGMLMRDHVKILNIAGGVVASSILFFLLTNFGAWLGNPFYPQNIVGLMESYTLGLAFYQNSLFGNLFLNTLMSEIFFAAILFGVMEIVKQRMPQLVRA